MASEGAERTWDYSYSFIGHGSRMRGVAKAELCW